MSAQRGNRKRERGGSLGVCGLARPQNLLGAGSEGSAPLPRSQTTPVHPGANTQGTPTTPTSAGHSISEKKATGAPGAQAARGGVKPVAWSGGGRLRKDGLSSR